MNEAMLCVTILVFMGWIAYLKFQVGGLKSEVDRLVSRLKRVLRQHGKDVELGDDQAVSGRKPGWLK